MVICPWENTSARSANYLTIQGKFILMMWFILFGIIQYIEASSFCWIEISTTVHIATYAELGRDWALITSIAWTAMPVCLVHSRFMYAERNALKTTALFAMNTFSLPPFQSSPFHVVIWCIQHAFRYPSFLVLSNSKCRKMKCLMILLTTFCCP